MNEVKKPRKPLIFYYCITLAVVMLFNLLFMPMLADSYEYVYGIDYRSWKGDLSAFVEEHGIDTVVVINYQVCISLPSYVSAWERFVSQ